MDLDRSFSVKAQTKSTSLNPSASIARFEQNQWCLQKFDWSYWYEHNRNAMKAETNGEACQNSQKRHDTQCLHCVHLTYHHFHKNEISNPIASTSCRNIWKCGNGRTLKDIMEQWTNPEFRRPIKITTTSTDCAYKTKSYSQPSSDPERASGSDPGGNRNQDGSLLRHSPTSDFFKREPEDDDRSLFIFVPEERTPESTSSCHPWPCTTRSGTRADWIHDYGLKQAWSGSGLGLSHLHTVVCYNPIPLRLEPVLDLIHIRSHTFSGAILFSKKFSFPTALIPFLSLLCHCFSIYMPN